MTCSPDAVDRATSPIAGTSAGLTAVASTALSSALPGVDGAGALIALLVTAGVLTVAHLGLQFQAAALIMRDGRWLASLPAAGICVLCLVALYLLRVEPVGGGSLLVGAAVCTVLHATCLTHGTSSTLRQ